jgi:acyl-homoserine-lactone acylase
VTQTERPAPEGSQPLRVELVACETPPMGRILGRLAAGLAVAVLAVLAYAFLPMSAPHLDVHAASSQPYEATISRDRFGIPHVHGARDADTAYGLAWAHAEDDFLTIQQSTLAARGRLATVEGREAAPIDYTVALLRVREVTAAGYPTIAPETRAILEGYAAGLNAYAAAHTDEVISRELFPVTGEDLVAASVQKAPLFYGFEVTLGALFDPAPLDEHVQALARPTSLDAVTAAGSNVLVVGPGRTPDGATHLVSNSHQPWTGPVAWYEATLTSDEGWRATGALFPGVPTIVLGHNEQVAWSFTVNRPDLIDVYRLDVDPQDPTRYRVDGEWLEMEVDEADLEVRIIGRLRWTVTREVAWTIFGPVVRREDGDVALRWAGMGTVGIFEQLHRFNRAGDIDEWRAALASQDGLASFNMGVADASGRIAYLYNAMLPRRPELPGVDWSAVVPGDTRATLWTDSLAFEELPWVEDPPAGFLQNANSTPFTATLGEGRPDPSRWPEATTGIERYETNRSLRALDLLGGTEPIDLDRLLAIKFDTRYDRSSAVATWRDRLVASRDLLDGEDERAGLDALAAWDLDAGRDSVGTAVMVVTIAELFDDDRVDLDPARLGDDEVADEVGAAVLLDAYRQAVAWLVEGHGRVDVPWGEVNRLRRGSVDLQLDGAPDVLRAIYGRRADGGILEAFAGDAYLAAITFGADGVVRSQAIHQFGSATLDVGSPHHADQAERFASAQLREVPFTDEELASAAVVTYRAGEGRPSAP